MPLPCCMGFETRPSERDGARTCLLPVISVISLLFGESQAPGQGGRDAFTHPGSPRLAVPEQPWAPGTKPHCRPLREHPGRACWTGRFPWQAGKLQGQRMAGPGAGMAIPFTPPRPWAFPQGERSTAGCVLASRPLLHAVPPSFQRTAREGGH